MSADTDLELRLARAYLLCVAEPPAPALSAFVAEHGPAAAAELVRAGNVPKAVARETWARRHRDVAAELEMAAQGEGRLVIPEDDEWPTSLVARLGVAAPLALWVRGRARLDFAMRRAATIVGARQATEHGRRVAHSAGRVLAAHGTAIVSGAVAGVDTCAHDSALAADGVTVAVVAYGLNVEPPASHADLMRRIAERGLIVSEYSLDVQANRQRYLARNRLQAALSQGTFLVEGAVRSGAHLVAREAARLRKPVMVPGAGSASPACAAMVRDGSARLVHSANEIAQILGGHRRNRADGNEHFAPVRAPAPAPLTGEALVVHQRLGTRSGKSAEQLAEETGLIVLRVRALLPTLELDGLSERCESGWRRAS